MPSTSALAPSFISCHTPPMPDFAESKAESMALPALTAPSLTDCHTPEALSAIQPRAGATAAPIAPKAEPASSARADAPSFMSCHVSEAKSPIAVSPSSIFSPAHAMLSLMAETAVAKASAIVSPTAVAPSFTPSQVRAMKRPAAVKALPTVSPTAAAPSFIPRHVPARAEPASSARAEAPSLTPCHMPDSAEPISSARAAMPSAMLLHHDMKRLVRSSHSAFAPSQTSSQFLYSIHAAVTSSPMARTTGFASTESDRAFHAFRTILITPQTARMPTKAAVSLPIVLSRSTPEVLSQFMAFVSVSVSPFVRPSHFQKASNSLLPPLR